MRYLHVDIETYCELPLGKTEGVGVYKYAQHHSFHIDLFSYQWDEDEVITLDCHLDRFAGETVQREAPDVWEVLKTGKYRGEDVLLLAHNANFEIVCLYFGWNIPFEPWRWFCTMTGAAYLGLPLKLEAVAKVLKLSQQKDNKGKLLITYFAQPVKKPIAKNNYRTRNLPEDAPEKWEAYKGYNAQDVRTELAIFQFICRFPGFSDEERSYWVQDQFINMRGFCIDADFVRAAIKANAQFIEGVNHEMQVITGLNNPNSLIELKRWLNDNIGFGDPITSLNKDFFKDTDLSLYPEDVRRVLTLRQMAANTSISKYDKMLAMLCDDGLIRGVHQYYGANATGRFAGRGLQAQNLKKTFSNADYIAATAKRLNCTYEAVETLVGNSLLTAKEAVRQGWASLWYDNIPDIVSRLIRAAIVAAPGRSLVPCDFSAIEARVLAWLAGEDWVLDVFKTHGKLYEATASRMFGIPIDQITKGSEWRAKGKIAALALGYQGAAPAMVRMGAIREGIKEDELPGIVSGYRASVPRIVKFWRLVEGAAKHVITKRTAYTVRTKYTSIRFSYEKGYLFITLPSGRRLAYYGASVRHNRIKCYRLNDKGVWGEVDLYGGLLTENITQAVARDCLVEAMYNMRDTVDILFHVHDEIVGEADDDKAAECLEYMEKIMSVSPLWASDLPLAGDGFISKYYRKD